MPTQLLFGKRNEQGLLTKKCINLIINFMLRSETNSVYNTKYKSHYATTADAFQKPRNI